jgi:hypothetical protein
MAYAHRTVTVGFSMTLAIAAAACGGAPGNGVTTGNEGGAADGAAGMDSGGGETGAPQDASAGNDGAGPVDASHGGDSSEPPTDGGSTGTIACGMATTCTVPSQVCCAVLAAADAGGHSSSCVAAGTCGKGLSISCEGTDNCPAGDVCCLSGGNGSSSTSCKPKCTGAQLCNKPSDCPPSETCRSIGELGGLGLCEVSPHDAGAD